MCTCVVAVRVCVTVNVLAGAHVCECVCVLLGVSLMMDAVILVLTPLLLSELTRLLRYSGLILDSVICCYCCYYILLSALKPLLMWKFSLPRNGDDGICAALLSSSLLAKRDCGTKSPLVRCLPHPVIIWGWVHASVHH